MDLRKPTRYLKTMDRMTAKKLMIQVQVYSNSKAVCTKTKTPTLQIFLALWSPISSQCCRTVILYFKTSRTWIGIVLSGETQALGVVGQTLMMEVIVLLSHRLRNHNQYRKTLR